MCKAEAGASEDRAAKAGGGQQRPLMQHTCKQRLHSLLQVVRTNAELEAAVRKLLSRFTTEALR